MANVRKRILELTPLPSASLDTTIVGVDGGTTYRIELDVLADAVTSRVNILDRDRLASLESVTSSFESKGRSVISSSAQITTLGFISSSVTIPAGTISSSAQITTLGFISSSTDITSLNSFTQSFSSSQSSLNTAFINGISARLQTSSFNDFSTSVDSRIIAATNEQSLTHLVTTSSFNEYTTSISTGSLVNRLNAIESVSGSWITESETGSFLTSLSGAISSSTQISDLGFVTGSYTTINSFNSLTQSFNSISQSFNVISGSVGGIDFTGVISGSSQLTSSFDTRYVASGSISAVPAGTISGSSQLTSSYDSRYLVTGSVTSSISNLNSFTSSLNIWTSSVATTGSNSFNGNQTITGSLVVSSVAVVNGGLTIPTGSVITLTTGSSIFVDSSGAITGSLTGSVFGIGDVVAFSASLNSRIISGSSVAGTISGSSQLTSSFDTRYAISASFVSSSNLSSIQTITSASYAALTPVSGTLYIIIG